MNYLDTYYRAFAEYEKNIKGDRSVERLCRAISAADAADDRIEIIKTECRIDDDWVQAIDEGLDHIGKAIAQERQFILSNGEVVPIDKVKSVSRETIVHLAKHSNFLKKVENSDEIMPEKLYTVERLSDYAVYENRFLYMLLRYLQDFITYRLNKIIDITNKYCGSLRIRKTVNADGRKLVFESSLDEEIMNDPLVSENNPLKQKISTINGLLSAVLVYLSTPLMEEVAKAAKLRPPITETNVLKMDKNFKGAMQLYHFVTAYEGDGFTVEQTKKVISPFGELLAAEMAESIALTSFITYKHAMGAEDYLKERFRHEELRRKQAAEAEQLEKIRKLKKQIELSGVGAEEYMVMLEQRNRSLEGAAAQLKATTAALEKAENRIAELTDESEEKSRQLVEAEERHIRETESLTAEYEGRLAEQDARRRRELEQLSEEHRRHCSEYENKISSLEESIDREKAAAEERVATVKEQAQQRIDAAEQEAQLQKDIAEQATGQMEGLREQNAIICAKYNAVRHQYGLFTKDDDFTSQTDFDELERQYNIFTKFFKGEWKKAKKRIRREVLGKSRKNKDESPDGEEVKNSETMTDTSQPEEGVENTENNVIPEDGALKQDNNEE